MMKCEAAMTMDDVYQFARMKAVVLKERGHFKGLDTNDLVQELAIGYWQALEKYDPESGAKWQTYLNGCTRYIIRDLGKTCGDERMTRTQGVDPVVLDSYHAPKKRDWDLLEGLKGMARLDSNDFLMAWVLIGNLGDAFEVYKDYDQKTVNLLRARLHTAFYDRGLLPKPPKKRLDVEDVTIAEISLTKKILQRFDSELHPGESPMYVFVMDGLRTVLNGCKGASAYRYLFDKHMREYGRLALNCYNVDSKLRKIKALKIFLEEERKSKGETAWVRRMSSIVQADFEIGEMAVSNYEKARENMLAAVQLGLVSLDTFFEEHAYLGSIQTMAYQEAFEQHLTGFEERYELQDDLFWMRNRFNRRILKECFEELCLALEEAFGGPLPDFKELLYSIRMGSPELAPLLERLRTLYDSFGLLDFFEASLTYWKEYFFRSDGNPLQETYAHMTYFGIAPVGENRDCLEQTYGKEFVAILSLTLQMNYTPAFIARKVV